MEWTIQIAESLSLLGLPAFCSSLYNPLTILSLYPTALCLFFFPLYFSHHKSFNSHTSAIICFLTPHMSHQPQLSGVMLFHQPTGLSVPLSFFISQVFYYPPPIANILHIRKCLHLLHPHSVLFSYITDLSTSSSLDSVLQSVFAIHFCLLAARVWSWDFLTDSGHNPSS